MRRRIFLVVMAATTLVVVSFVLPLMFTVRTLAEQQAMADADHQVGNVGALVAGGVEPTKLGRILGRINAEQDIAMSVLLPDGQVLGDPSLDPDDDDITYAVTERRSGSVVDASGGQVFLTVVDGDAVTVIRGFVPTEVLYAGVDGQWRNIISLGVGALVVSGLMGLRLGRRASEPLADVADAATRLRGGDLSTRAEVGGTRETVELARTLNDMADRQSELIETERTAMALSHRLRTVLTAMRLDAASVPDSEIGRRLIGHIDALNRSTDAVSRQGLRAATGGGATTCDAVEVARQRAHFWQRVSDQEKRVLSLRLPERSLTVSTPADQLADMIDVLIDNVFVHTPHGTSYSLQVSEENGNAVIVVSDGGTGAAAGSAGPTSDALGTGLEIAGRTARDAGGELKVRWSTPQGTEVAATLPLVVRNDLVDAL